MGPGRTQTIPDGTDARGTFGMLAIAHPPRRRFDGDGELTAMGLPIHTQLPEGHEVLNRWTRRPRTGLFIFLVDNGPHSGSEAARDR